MSALAGGVIGRVSSAVDVPVAVSVRVGDQNLALNELLGTRLSLSFSGHRRCTLCGDALRGNRNSGWCYDCFSTRASCDLCFVSPDRCHHHLGTCREPRWGEEVCLQPHLLYLANSSGLKVGITRSGNAVRRWLEQGASQGLVIGWAASRRIAGTVEKQLGSEVAEHTRWRSMLANHERLDLGAARDRLRSLVDTSVLAGFGAGAFQWIAGGQYAEFQWPRVRDVFNARPFSPDLNAPSLFGGTLQAVRGQWLVFDAGVISLGRVRGWEVEFTEGAPPGIAVQEDLFA